MAFDLVEGKRGNKLLPLDASTTLGAIRSSNRGAEFVRLWGLPDTYISTENATMWPDDRTEPSMDTSPIPDMETSASLGASSSQVATYPIEAEDRVEDEVSFILRVDKPFEEHSPGYVEAGTPTVLFRRTNGVIDIARSSDDLFLMEVRRGSALKDALGLVLISQGDLASPLRIRFIGDSLVKGKSSRLTFQKNYVEGKKRNYFHLGQLAALSILQDGPGFPVFADAVVSYITGQRDAAVNKEDIDDRIGSVIEQMRATSDLVQLQQLFSSNAIDALDVGFVVPSTSFRREHIALLEGVFAEDLVSSCREELDQFIEGLRTHDVLQMITSNAWPLLSGRLRPVIAAAMRSLLRFKYRDGNLRQGDQATAQAFLAFLQATKCTLNHNSDASYR
ncbi:hypothetical protein DPMN_107657 [Dreissena polymorpha]|uniref:Uncharacterized protein n=1 Tax=Dreissena polymorpha TaxID=45954 RepID=A0A9D4K7G1_DREPO|nr:hypothetical protein DPMN_107657 [Dreissena polymorpha]